MFRTFLSLSSTLALLVSVVKPVAGQQATVYELLPDSVQAVVWIPDSKDLTDRWDRTLLHELGNQPALKPFFSDQQEMIQNRLMEAGWRLGVKPQELTEFFKGQLTVAWLELLAERKPFALVMIADVGADQKVHADMLTKIDNALAQHKAAKKQLQHLNQEITQYTLPRRTGQLLDENTFLATASGKLLVSDDLPQMQNLIAKLQGQAGSEKALQDDADFLKTRQELRISGKAQIEYFVRPLGIARVIRAISGKRSKNSADILAVLKNQGFTAVRSIAGEIWVAAEGADMAHRGFVLADFPLPRSAGVLEFPNAAMADVPSFVGENASSFMALNWDAQTAFWKARELVDELVGNQGVFDEVINGIKNDVNGPQVDIRNEFLPLLTNDILAVTDAKSGPVDVDSRRNLIALKVNDGAKAAAILNRVMKAEANAELLEIDGVAVWKVTNAKDDNNSEEFAEFGAFDDSEEETEEPWLNQWAICVLDGYFVFASHTEMIEEAVAQSRRGQQTGLSAQADYQRIRRAVVGLMDEQTPCAWKISRNHLAFRVQYELFRQGKLQESESMLSTLLNRVVQQSEEAAGGEAKAIDGHSLPPFEEISHYLQPSGLKVLTTHTGWEFGGIWLGRPEAEPTELTSNYEAETARIVDSASEAKR
ncbi:MAG: hypothetical protein KF752_15000 [Pirellulaceae bacterium]|nr:hypothetical protein [Pirellulaceae bacterium]